MRLIAELQARRLVAIVRGTSAAAALDAVITLHECGVPLIEVSLTTPDATGVVRRAVEMIGAEATIGCGTVVTADDAARVAACGARFAVTPALGPGVAAALNCGLPVIGGAFTPSEMVEVMARGAIAVKLFPASAAGPGYVQAVHGPFPAFPIVPVGGVDAVAAQAYLAAGAIAVGVGSPLVGDAASGGSLAALRERVPAFLAAAAR